MELDVDSIWSVRRRVGDRQDPATWFDLARDLRLALELDQRENARSRGASRRSNALKQAERLVNDETYAAAVAEIDADLAAEREQPPQGEGSGGRPQAAHDLTPEALDWRPDVWPTLTDEQQQAAVDQDARRRAGDPREGGHAARADRDEVLPVLLRHAAQGPSRAVGERARHHVPQARRAVRLPGVEDSIFWGKAVIFVFNDRERFRLVEAQSFQSFVADWVDGICHPLGPQVFVSFYRQPRTEVFGAVLIHETTHGFMHRYRTPMRLPTWANEGIADYMASILFETSTVDLVRRRPGTRWIRRGGDVNDVLDMSYADGTWPGENEIGYAVGYLLVDLMIKDRPREFAAWVNAIKAGKDWEVALVEDYGVTRAELVAAATQYFKVND